MNALDPTVRNFVNASKHSCTAKRRRLNAMIDGATDDQVRGLLDRHKARMTRYVRWENWPVGECPPAGGRVKSGEVAPLTVGPGIDCWLFIPDEFWRRARSTFRLFAFAVTGITASSWIAASTSRRRPRQACSPRFSGLNELAGGTCSRCRSERHDKIVDTFLETSRPLKLHLGVYLG